MKAAVLVASALLLFGCGSGSSPMAVTSSTQATGTTTSTAQAASVVAKHRGEILKAIDDACHSGSLLTCLAVSARLARFQQIGNLLAALETELLRSLPASREITKLALDTLGVLSDARTAAGPVGTCVNANLGKSIDPCEPALAAWSAAVQKVPAQLAAWEPYI